MTTETPAPGLTEGSKIEQTLKIYVMWDDVNHRWAIDPVTVDGHALDTNDSASNDLDAEHWTAADTAEMDAANAAPVPNADQLVLLLLEALPAESTIKSAVAEVLDGARCWAEELTTYIAKGSAEYGDEESANNQRDTAAAIHAAMGLLRG
jgi:hypothetical protein